MHCNAQDQNGPLDDLGDDAFEFIPLCGEPITRPSFDHDRMRAVVVECCPFDPACQLPPGETDPANTVPPPDTEPHDTR